MTQLPEPTPVVEVVDAGFLSIIEDLGRPGLAEIGVGPSGAADLDSFRLANRLVANAEDAAAIEFVLGAVAFRFHRTTTVALTGAPADVRIGRPDGAGGGSRGCAFNAPFSVRPGEELRVGRPARGLRSYLAVHGGIGVPPVLGSRSWDTLAEIGPPPLRRGDLLPLAGQAAGFPAVDVAPVRSPSDGTVLGVLPGPRADWFEPGALDVLFSASYEITAQTNRIGIRLDGVPLRVAAARELPPEGMVTGALQVPPSGQPVLFLADHPVTGGYPVIGVVSTADIPLAAQLRPGDTLRFARTVSPPL